MDHRISDRERIKIEATDSVKSYLEIDLRSGLVVWINSSLSKKCLLENKEVLNASVYGLVDEAFRGKLSVIISDNKHLPKRTIWPVSCLEEKISWWVTNLEYADSDYLICSCDIVLVTNRSGTEFKLAAMSADNAYTISTLLSEITSIKLDIKEFKAEIQSEVSNTRNDISEAIQASKKAELAALSNKESTDELKSQVTNQFSVHTKEIMKLMTSDVIHDSRMATFENHVKKTTTEALEKIISQADASGKYLGRKISIPMGAVTIVLGIIQWLVSKYLH